MRRAVRGGLALGNIVPAIRKSAPLDSASTLHRLSSVPTVPMSISEPTIRRASATGDAVFGELDPVGVQCEGHVDTVVDDELRATADDVLHARAQVMEFVVGQVFFTKLHHSHSVRHGLIDHLFQVPSQAPLSVGDKAEKGSVQLAQRLPAPESFA